MNASELVIRVNAEMNAQGIKTNNYYGKYWTEHENKLGARLAIIEEVYRSNATSEDVTAKIEVYEANGLNLSGNINSLKGIAKIKVPKNASDKVIAKRVAAAIEALNA